MGREIRLLSAQTAVYFRFAENGLCFPYGKYFLRTMVFWYFFSIQKITTMFYHSEIKHFRSGVNVYTYL